jgi:hypothetical protein
MVWTCFAFVTPSAHANPLAEVDAGPLANAQVTRIALDDETNLPAARLNEKIIGIPADATGKIVLETTIYKPDGPGPFPMIVFNHGKVKGDPRKQKRSEPLPLA